MKLWMVMGIMGLIASCSSIPDGNYTLRGRVLESELKKEARLSQQNTTYVVVHRYPSSTDRSSVDIEMPVTRQDVSYDQH